MKKYIPEYLYVSSTVHVEKKEEGFNYELTHKSLTINNLSIEDTIEPFLIQQGFINKTPRGRVITQKAYKHLNIEFRIPNDTLI